ncbi:MAG: endonuclease/exonuclease/phosphatase family protein [Thiohalophilus sp.]|nr:endonuclease/exonuclease/phosphatase family protein [Thiohalophilus sp.]MDZ7661548.1 endonuclease/exonuclease/phosphatase family protein [Thiohalophilus sp.]
MLTLASWNVNSLRVRLLQVLDWLAVNQPDLVGLQETKLQDEHFPLAEFNAAGYNVVANGQKTYNGVALPPFAATSACASTTSWSAITWPTE